MIAGDDTSLGARPGHPLFMGPGGCFHFRKGHIRMKAYRLFFQPDNEDDLAPMSSMPLSRQVMLQGTFARAG